MIMVEIMGMSALMVQQNESLPFILNLIVHHFLDLLCRCVLNPQLFISETYLSMSVILLTYRCNVYF